MQNLILSQYKLVYINQCRLKFLKKNIYYLTGFKSLTLNTSYPKLESLKNTLILETFYYFRLISNKKSYISFFKKKYKEVDLSISLDILYKNADYFFLLLILYFLPLILQKETLFKTKFLHKKNLTIILNSYNFYPFIPNIFYAYTKKLLLKIIFLNDTLSENKLILSYYKINSHLMK